MPADEFYQWMYYEAIEPFGDRRADLHAGIIAHVIANCFRSEKHRSYKPSDFMPRWEEPPAREQSAAEIEGLMLMLQAAQNARIANS